jgi:hypothetical protein
MNRLLHNELDELRKRITEIKRLIQSSHYQLFPIKKQQIIVDQLDSMQQYAKHLQLRIDFDG